MADENWRSFEQALHKSQEGSPTQPILQNGAIGSIKLPLAALQRTGSDNSDFVLLPASFSSFLNKLLKEKDVNKPLGLHHCRMTVPVCYFYSNLIAWLP